MQIVKRILSLVLVASACQVFANDKDKEGEKGSGTPVNTTVLNVETLSHNASYRLVYRSAEAGPVQVSIANEQGRILLTDKIQNVNGFCRPYNFSQLPDGRYTLTIQDAHEKVTKVINHGIASGASQAIAAKVTVMPTTDPAKYELNVIGNQGQPIDVVIYDSFNQVIHRETIQEKGNFRKVYNLSQVSNRGGISFEVGGANSSLQQFNF